MHNKRVIADDKGRKDNAEQIVCEFAQPVQNSLNEKMNVLRNESGVNKKVDKSEIFNNAIDKLDLEDKDCSVSEKDQLIEMGQTIDTGCDKEREQIDNIQKSFVNNQNEDGVAKDDTASKVKLTAIKKDDAKREMLSPTKLKNHKKDSHTKENNEIQEKHDQIGNDEKVEPMTIEEKRRQQSENKITIEEKRRQQRINSEHKFQVQISGIKGIVCLFLIFCELMNMYISIQIFRYAEISYALIFFVVLSIMIGGIFSILLKYEKFAITIALLLSVFLTFGSVVFYRISCFTNTVFHGAESETVMIVSRKDSSLESSSDFMGLRIAFVKSDAPTNLLAEYVLKKEGKTNYEKIEYQTYQEAYTHLMDQTVDLMIYTFQARDMLEEVNLDSWRNVKVILEGKKELESVESKGVDIARQPFNVLISGVDQSSSGINEKGNSDVNIILSVNPNTKRIIMQTIPRDSWAPLSCYDDKHTKLTYAGRNGGINCSIKTIEKMYDITIHYFAKINFQGVVDLVDAFGGITINNNIPFCTSYQDRYDIKREVCFEVGENKVDGAQALIYSRVRKIFSDGDIERGRHQMEVINGVIREFQKAPTKINLNRLLETIEDNFSTNFDENDIGKALKLLMNMQHELENIETFTMEGEMLWDTDEITNEYLYYFYPYDGQVELFRERIQNVMNGK